MLFTTVDPISPPHVLALIRAVQAVDPQAQVHIDATGRQARIDGQLNAQQAASALREAGLAGVVTGTQAHVAGGSTCCGGCS